MGFASLTISDGANSSAELNGWPPSISAVETPATGDVTEKEKPWEAYPKFTVYRENEVNPCGKCRHNASGCDTCLSPLEFKAKNFFSQEELFDTKIPIPYTYEALSRAEKSSQKSRKKFN